MVCFQYKSINRFKTDCHYNLIGFSMKLFKLIYES